MVITMGRKAASSSAVLHRRLIDEPEHTRRSVRTRRLLQTTRAAKAHRDQPRGGGKPAGPTGPKVVVGPGIIDDFPEFAAVLERELDAIEIYLGASLDEVLGRPD
jgi:hypothetical protein